jgi:hypothetical protein
MKVRKANFFWVFAVASFLAASAGIAAQNDPQKRLPPPGKVRGPWSDSRIGTRIEMKDIEVNYLQDIVTLKTMEVVAADDESVSIKLSGSVNGKMKNDQKASFPRFVPPSELNKLTDAWGRKIGQKKLTIKDKDVLCDVYERREKHPTEDVVGTRTTYVSEQAPTWIVRIDDHNEGQGRTTNTTPHQVLDFTWGPDGKAVLPKTETKPEKTVLPKTETKPNAGGTAAITAGAALPSAPATAANRALASELMTRLVKTYYSIIETEATGFDASYLVKRDGVAVGTARSTWNSEAGETKTKFAGSLNESDAGWLSTMANLGLLQSVFTEGDHDRLFAVRTGDGYVFSDEQAVNDTVKSRQALLSADLTQSGEVLRLANGVVRRIVRNGEKNGEKLFVRSARIIIDASDGARTVNYAFTFVTKGGLPFIGTMTVADKGVNGKTTSWVLALDTISFTRPAK